MKKILLMTMLVAMTACAANSPYKPAFGSGYGYRETRLASDRYRVSFRARDLQRDEAKDFALFRAAELTLLEGYDWFVVVDRETVLEHQRSSPTSTTLSASRSQPVARDCGLLGCTVSSYPQRQLGVDVAVGGERRRAESVLEIRLGRGLRPSSTDSYDAREVRETLKQSLELANR